MGAVSIALKDPFQIGQSKQLHWGKATMSSSYATGGDSLPAVPGDARFEMGVFTADGYLLTYDAVNRKLKAFRQTAATGALVEVPNATNLSTVVADFLAIGP